MRSEEKLGVDAAARLVSEASGIRVAPNTIRDWAKRGRVPHLRLVGRLVFDAGELSEWLEAAQRAGHVAAAGSHSSVMS